MKSVDELSSPSPGCADVASCVLVVDDEAAVRRFVVRVLQREGYQTAEAIDGADALDMVRAQAILYAGVVSDIVMPRLNGVELLQELAVLHPGLPVILMSGYATNALTELGIAAPCGVIAKPFAAEQLVAEVQRCIRSR